MTDQVHTHVRSKNYGKCPAAVMHDLSLSHLAVRVYAHMHWRGGKDLQHFEGMKSMGKFLGVSNKAISDAIFELEARDWVIVVYRPKNEKGQMQTPFYHVFEDQEDCGDFRKSYKPSAGEIVREALPPSERKSRRGVGGRKKPAETQSNSSSPGDEKVQSNSSSGGMLASQSNSSSDSIQASHGNSSSTYPEIGDYPESKSYPESFSAPSGTGATAHPDAITQAVGVVEELRFKEVMDDPWDEKPLELYDCTEKDIASLIAAWWEWVPMRPALRGKPSELKDHMKVPTNREYARNLYQRGVRPADFVLCLANLRREIPQAQWKPMTFQYVCPIVDEWTAKTRQEELGWYNPDDPRITPRKRDSILTPWSNPWEHQDIAYVDVPPRYISIQSLETEETPTPDDDVPSEFESYTPADWERIGMPL